MTFLENEYLRVGIRLQGAELTSVYNKAAGIEHLWQADPKVWGWHAPNLFPVVGGLINNQLMVNGQAYPMQRHGFARPTEFRLAEATKSHAVFSLQYSEKTLTAYPYKFNFQVLYDLIENSLRVTYKVINLDSKPIYFSVGGHPAFNVPFFSGEQYQDYYLEFETAEQLITHQLSQEGFFNGQTLPIKTEGNKLPLHHDLFAADALVFKNLKSRAVSIKTAKHEQWLTVEFPHYSYLGIWAKPGADFVCVEPWLGCADSVGEPKDITEKEAIQRLEYGHVFEAPYFITIGA
ncbi:aldose 1-epimerase family protein [Mucilaginibacter sp. RS28]|uniref:Aldose 1-epimerase family protein n=1 Tax=Mucilaginibacter straminoryzae TaxID=2932774 RepID=A0A9X1X4I1_9SPHI|nr:aldose 1-epimerase family protein [Mucilaginibacter straminoryzae]MCJ8209458.1 aldose 1-epimerase family protein [Mucilaginibacter straminoryzae]